MEVRPGWGVGVFRFGLTEADLAKALGSPDRRYTTDSGVLRLQYFGPRVEFAIEPENGGRFGWAEDHNPDTILFGFRVVGEEALAVVAAVSEALGEQPECEEFGWGESYFFFRNWVELSVQFGRVVSVNLGVLYDESDGPRWPDA
jgi:hypothetical protein